MRKILSEQIAEQTPHSALPSGSEAGGDAAGYLAVYPALYEPDMGVEFAQFPSKEYTSTYRTDVLFYGISGDGKKFEPLNHNKAVMSPQGCIRLQSPSLFRRHGGGYGLAAATDEEPSGIVVFDSDDLLYYRNQRIIKLSDRGITVKRPTVESSGLSYKIFWEDGSGKSYVTVTDDFEEFSEPVEAEYKREYVNASLPDYAAVSEAAVFPLTAEEYGRIIKKYGRLYSVAVEAEDIAISAGEEVVLPERVDVVYSDGSRMPMGVRWDLRGLDPGRLAPGEYIVKGTVTATGEYNSPIARFRADPYAVYDEERKVYYFTGSNMNENSANGGGAYQSIVIRRARSINGITYAEEFEVWRDTTLEDGTRVTGWYWAPEIHKINGKWRIIALASVKQPLEFDGVGRQCIFTCNGDDLTDPGSWEYTGFIHDTQDGQSVGSFDTTYFEYGGQSYYVTPKWSSIWITPVDPENLLFPTGPLVRLSTADRAYETNNGSGKAGYNNMSGGRIGQAIQEASSVLIHGDKIFIAYAGCTIDMMYCVCLLYAELESDLLNPDSWRKYPYPILGTQDITETVKKADYTAADGTKNVTGHGDSGLSEGSEGEYRGTFGPGHNSFTVDENGNPVIIYHARDWDDVYPGAVGPDKYGLVDPGRHAYARPMIFNYEGFPVCNLTPEEYLAQSLRVAEIKITVR